MTVSPVTRASSTRGEMAPMSMRRREEGSAQRAAEAAATPRRVRRRGALVARTGQIVAAQAAVVLVVAAAGAGYLALALVVPVAAAVVVLAWGRLRRRWLYEWLGVGLRYLTRDRGMPARADGAALLTFVRPGARVEVADIAGDTAAVVTDAFGVTAVLELGDPVGLLAEAGQGLPSPANLLPAGGPDAPRVQIQLVLSGMPAPVARAGAATSATSYRQLTEGRLLGQERILLAVRILRDEGWSEADLRRALSGVVRKVHRRLGAVPARVLGETAVLRVLTDLAQHDGAQPAREAWPGVHLGGLLHATFRLVRWPDARAEAGRRLVPRLLTLPTTSTTIALTAGPRLVGPAGTAAPAGLPGSGRAGTGKGGTGKGGAGKASATPTPGAAGEIPVDLVVRLSAGNVGALNGGVQALGRLVSTDGASARRLDGEHLEGFAATLPLGGPDSTGPAGLAASGPLFAGTLDGLELPVGDAGLMIGTNRHGEPLVVRLFRADPTRAMIVGGVRGAQLIAMRAMALGARVVVQTARPYAWEPFVRAVSTPGETIMVIPPGRPVTAPPGSPLYPLLIVVDVGPVAADGLTGGGWQASLIVRDDLAQVDADTLARADLVVLQPLRPDEAALAGVTLGLGDAAGWLTRIRPDMVGVVNRRAVRWAVLSATPIEQQLIGPPTRG